uniref:HECT domain-containing protein n=1 Tax=Poecilia formosa TaxID=48698 RepID=A0A096MDM0_POEFO
EDLEAFLQSRHVMEEDINRMKADKIDRSVISVMKDEEFARYVPSYGDRLAVMSFCRQRKRHVEVPQQTTVRNSGLMARPKNNNAVKSKRRVEVGWLHFQSGDFHQVRSKFGGGTRHLALEKNTTVSEVMTIAKELFFPCGLSSKGSIMDFTLSMCDFKRQTVFLDSTLTELYEQFKFKMLQLYLCTKDLEHSSYSSEDQEDFEQVLSHPGHGKPPPKKPHNVGRHTRHSTSAPSAEPLTSMKSLQGYMSVNSSHHLISDDEASMSPQPKALTDGTEGHNPVYVIDDNVELLYPALHSTPGPSNQETEYFYAVDKAPQTAVVHMIPSVEYDALPSATGGVVHPKDPRYAHIRRAMVIDDLLNLFMDKSIMESELKMEFNNEMAVDNSGVSRDVYTAFGEQFLELCEGEEERVPKLRPDFSEERWYALGRIWAKGLIDHGIFPVRLSKAFIIASVLGLQAVEEEVLMSSFSKYLSESERSIIEKALSDVLEEDEADNLWGAHRIPCQENVKQAIKVMAHKVILQEPKYIIDCFYEIFKDIALNLSHPADVLHLYEVDMLQTEALTLSQKEQTTFTYLQRYIRNADQRKLEKFLRFCKGSSVLCTEEIKVTFNAETGFGRRPVAHTCGAIIDVPYTYSSYPEFRAEFDSILASNFMLMDII